MPYIPKNIRQMARRLRSRIAEEEEPSTCALFLMPKGLSLIKLRDLVQITDKHKTKFNDNGSFISFKRFGDVPIEKSYGLLFSNDIMEGSGEAFIAKKAGTEHQVPLLLEGAVCAFMNHAIAVTSAPGTLRVVKSWSKACDWL